MRAKNLRRLLATLILMAAVAATVMTTPAAAQNYLVTVRVEDGTLYTVVVDLPPGATLADVVGAPGVPGTPISMVPLPDPPPPPPPPPAPPPPAQPPPDQGTAPAQPPGGGRDTPGDPPGTDTTAPEPQHLSEQPEPQRSVQTPTVVAERPASGLPVRKADGSPTTSNPGFVDVLPGPSSASGVPNFIIRKFRVPPFLLPIYQAAGVEYGVRWEILAAINEIETDYGRNLRVSSAGAVGWMQFLPSSWKRYGVDANRDGRRDPYNPVDAIFAAAHYLQAAGFADDPQRAVFAYNHADWYVDSVFLRARLLATIPVDLIGSLTGLTEARFPVRGHASYADDVAEQSRRSVDIFASTDTRVVAVNDGVVERVGRHVLVLQDVYGNHFRYADLGRVARELRGGTRVRGGTTVGHIGRGAAGSAPHLRFSIRPSGRGAPTIDPKPILDGWQLLEATAVYRANGENVLRGGETIGQTLLLPKSLLQKRVLADPRIDIYPCGRDDIAAGVIDRRVLATLEYLAESGLSPTVASLRCGHSYHTKSGNISEHSSGNAVDISAVNGVSILGHQEPGGIADQTVRRLLLLQGTMVPHQVISLLQLGGPSLAMGDHADHIHVGFRPAGEAWRRAGYSVLKPSQWPELMSRLNALPNPDVSTALQAR